MRHFLRLALAPGALPGGVRMCSAVAALDLCTQTAVNDPKTLCANPQNDAGLQAHSQVSVPLPSTMGTDITFALQGSSVFPAWLEHGFAHLSMIACWGPNAGHLQRPNEKLSITA